MTILMMILNLGRPSNQNQRSSLLMTNRVLRVQIVFPGAMRVASPHPVRPFLFPRALSVRKCFVADVAAVARAAARLRCAAVMSVSWPAVLPLHRHCVAARWMPSSTWNNDWRSSIRIFGIWLIIREAGHCGLLPMLLLFRCVHSSCAMPCCRGLLQPFQMQPPVPII